MNTFQETKRNITPKQGISYYLGSPKKSGPTDFYYSPFRKEKTPSLGVHNSKGITDFGTNEHYDIISFVAKLYNLSNIDACRKLIQDFGLDIPIDGKIDRKEIERINRQRDENKRMAVLLCRKLNTFYSDCISKYRIFQQKRVAFEKVGTDYTSPVFRWIRQGEIFYDALTERFLNSDFAKQVELMERHKEEYFFKLRQPKAGENN